MSEFRDMRRKRQQLSEAESIGILQKATSGTLALLGDNGYPYAVPISYVYHEGKLYFHSRVSNLMYPGKRKMKILTPPLPLPYKGLLFIHISGLGESDDFEVLIESV